MIFNLDKDLINMKPLTIVWFNTLEYTPIQLTSYLIGIGLWTIVYVFTIKNIFKNRFCEIPGAALSGKFAWEILWSFHAVPNMGFIFEIGYKLWLILDIVIVWGFFCYGYKQVISQVNQYFRIYFILGILFWLITLYFFINDGFDNLIGSNSFYVLNILMSVLYIFMFLRLENEYKKLFSSVIAWTKCFGTGFISLMVYLKWPNNNWVTALGIICFLIDFYYIFLVNTFKKRYQIEDS